MRAKFYLVKDFKKYKRAYVSKNTGKLYYIIGRINGKTPKYRFKWQEWTLYNNRSKVLGKFKHLMDAVIYINKEISCKITN